MRPEFYGFRGPEKQEFLDNYGKVQDELEFKREKGLVYRKISPDNPFQMGASRRLNKSFDQSTKPLTDVDYVKNVFDQSEPTFAQMSGIGNAQNGSPAPKGLFVTKRPSSKQAGETKPSKPDPQFTKNAGKFFE